jgi:cytochrome c oxidase subunit 4
MSTHTDTHAPHGESHEHEHHDSSIYLKNLVVLFILTAITVAASYINFGAGNVAIALFIASIKAILVALIFMHLKDDKPMYGIIAAAGFVFLGIFLMFDLLDYDARVKYQPFNYSPVVSTEKIPGASPAGKEGDAEKGAAKGGEKGGEKQAEKVGEKK